MKNLKVVQFLEALSPSEFEEFDKYVRSPFFNNNQESIQLFAELKAYYPDFPAESIRKEKMFKMAFPGASFSEKKKYTISVFTFITYC